jgi:cation diffusion facilitator family transporter
MAPNLRRPLWFSILAAVLTLALKAAAYWYTGSVGLLSDAAESGVNLVAAVTAMLSLWYSAQPVDRNHTYGHEKIEYFSSGLEGVLIAAAAVGIAWYAIRRLIVPQPIHELGVGAAVALVASLINLGVALWLLRTGRRYHSIVLEADGQHLMTDVWTSVALVTGLALVAATGIEVLDPILALVMAVNILWTGCGLVRRSFNGLMDHALPADELAVVRQAIESVLARGATYHALRTRQAGAHRFVDFHLLVPGRTSVRDAHHQAVRLEEAIQTALPSAEVVVHVEPIEEPASWQDSELLAVEGVNGGRPPSE